MARPRFNNIDLAKQEALLMAAAKEFADVGYEGASLNRILLAAGVSKGAFYYYFDDKADLACTVLLWAYRDILALYDGIDVPEDAARFWDAIYQFSRQGLALLDRVPYANDLVSRLSHAIVNDKELEARVVKVLDKPAEAWMTLLRRGQQLGAVRKDLSPRTMIGLMTAIKEAVVREHTSNNQILDRHAVERMSNLLLDLFRRICAPDIGAIDDPRSRDRGPSSRLSRRHSNS